MPAPHSPIEPRSFPRIPAAFIRALLPEAERSEVLDDLGTEFQERTVRDGKWRAWAWSIRQVARSLPALLRRSWWRGWTGFDPRANALQSGGPVFEQWIIDARYAARRLLRRPLYASLAILTLALGIGGTAAIFGIARGVFLDRLPYTDPKNIALFYMPFDWTQQEFAFLRGRVPGFAEVAQYRQNDVTLELGTDPAKLISGIATSSELFSVLGAAPALGRTFEPKDDVRGAEPVAVLSFELWQQLGGNQTVVGQRIRLDGMPHTVVGVMPRGFWFPTPTVRVWVPQRLDPEETNGNYAWVGRVAPGNSVDRMSGPLSALTRMLGERFQYVAGWDKTRDPWVRSMRESLVRPLRPALLATLVAMGMILLIACANVAALMLGQVEGRAVELAVRSALGADRARLTGQLVAEALILGVISGGVGAAVAAVSFPLLVNALPLGAWAQTASLDWSVFLVAMAVAVAAALAISGVPILALWRGRLRDSLVSGRTTGVSGRGVRLESSLVVAEVALAVLMTAGAGVLTRSVARLYAIDPGVDPRGVGVVDVVLPSDLPDIQRKRVIRDLVAEVRAVPGIENAAVVQRLPLRGGSWSSGIAVEGKPELAVTTTYVRFVSPGYLETMGMVLNQGRMIEEPDMSLSPGDSADGVAVITEALAKKYFAGEDPLGRRINVGFGPGNVRVIGVVRDVAEGDLTEGPVAVRYMPYESIGFASSGQTLVFRTSNGQNPVSLLETVRGAIVRAAPRVAIAETTTMEQVLALAVGPVRQIVTLVTWLTGLALLLGAIGIYGVMSHFVARRKRDWGIRIALGLRPSRVISGIVRRGTALVVVGIVLGLGAFVLLGRLLTPLIYGVGPTDPLAISVAVAMLLLVGVLAAFLPAARASRTDPVIVLREQ